jgi:CDGSH-type Zn-finger protein
MNQLTHVVGIAVTVTLAGCGLPIHKPFTIDGSPPTSVSVDAQQRMVFVTDKGGRYGTKEKKMANPDE